MIGVGMGMSAEAAADLEAVSIIGAKVGQGKGVSINHNEIADTDDGIAGNHNEILIAG